MITRKPYLITADGLERITTELEYLRTTKREQVAERLTRALEDGQDDDFVDNADLEAARNEQAFFEGRIIELEEIVRNYEIITKDKNSLDTVGVGDHVTVSEVGIDDEERYHLVGAAEASPSDGRISNVSPLGKALLGAKVNDVVAVEAPNGSIEFKVLKIE